LGERERTSINALYSPSFSSFHGGVNGARTRDIPRERRERNRYRTVKAYLNADFRRCKRLQINSSRSACRKRISTFESRTEVIFPARAHLRIVSSVTPRISAASDTGSKHPNGFSGFGSAASGVGGNDSTGRLMISSRNVTTT
jgi:hypothetical protein